MTITYVRSTFAEDQREFVEHFQYGKRIGKLLDMKNKQKRSQAQKPILLGLESGNHIPLFGIFEKYLKFVHEMSVHNGSDAFPNELTRFRIEAKPIWGKIQKRCKNEVII